MIPRSAGETEMIPIIFIKKKRKIETENKKKL